MRWAYPWIAMGTPLLVLGMAWLHRRAEASRRARRAAFSGSGTAAWADPGVSRRRAGWDFGLNLAVWAFLGLALARPLEFRKDERSELQGVPYLIGLDVSRSMLATDLKPNRFAVVTNAVDRFLAETRADRVGLLGFAGVAYLHAPLTFDMTALRTILRYVQPEDYIDPGSSLSAALDRAGRYFQSNNVPQRLLVLLSDGEDLEGRPVETARRWFRDIGLRVCTIGVGTPVGGQVPLTRTGTAVATNAFGQKVTTRLNESNLQRIANAAGGRYFPLGGQGEGLGALRRDFLAPLAEAVARENLQNYRELFQIPLLAALLCLVARIVIGAERTRRAVPASRIWDPDVAKAASGRGAGDVRMNG